jgi:hypothetical protein
MGTDRYPKGAKPGTTEPLHSEDTGNPYRNKAALGADAEEIYQRMNNIYGDGTSSKNGPESYPKGEKEGGGTPANPRRTMISS